MKTENEIIAEFMGMSEKHIQKCDISYDTNWSMLMPVVEKIESLGYNFWIGKYSSSVTKEGSGDPSFTVKGNNKIKVVYDVGLQFIRWYNSQNSLIL